MKAAGLVALLVALLACSLEEGERGRRHTDTAGDDLPGVDLVGYDGAVDLAADHEASPGDDVVPGDTVVRPDAPGPDVSTDVPGPDGSDVSHPDVPEATPDEALPDVADVKAEPQPETVGPEPEPEVTWPEPEPEVVDVTPDTAPPAQTAYDLQTGTASVGCSTDAAVTIGAVRLEGLVIASPRFVASTALDGYYAADAGSFGSYHGLLLVVPTSLATDFVVGDVVTVEGDYKEYYCMTEVYVASATQTGVAWEPAPVQIAGWQLAATDPGSEPYEGSLVRIQGGTVTLLDAFGEIEIDGTWRIANEFDLAYLADGGAKAVGDWIDSVTGVVEYSWGKYLVNPRFDSDLIVTKP